MVNRNVVDFDDDDEEPDAEDEVEVVEIEEKKLPERRVLLDELVDTRVRLAQQVYDVHKYCLCILDDVVFETPDLVENTDDV